MKPNNIEITVPGIDDLRLGRAGAIALEAVEHAKDMEFARSDPDQSAGKLINEYDVKRTAELDKELEDAKSRDAEKLAQIKAGLAERAGQRRVVGPDGQPMTTAEVAEHNQAVAYGALDRTGH